MGGFQAIAHPTMLGILYATAAVLPRAPSLRMSAPSLRMTPSANILALRTAWDRGDDATAMRPLVEACKGESEAAATAVAASTTEWAGLWLARIEHFEKVRFTGLRVNPHYEFAATGEIVSHVHIALGPLRAWASASGAMLPATDGSSNTVLNFENFWMAGDVPQPRDEPTTDARLVDSLIAALGRALFFEGLAAFPVDHADMDGDLVAFRFTGFDSVIVAHREPEGAIPQPIPFEPTATDAAPTGSPLDRVNAFLDRPILDTNERGGPLEPFKKFARMEPEAAQLIASVLAIFGIGSFWKLLFSAAVAVGLL